MAKVRSHIWCFLVAFFLLWGGASASFSATLQGDPTNYLDKLSRLKTGDELLLEAGIYRGGLPIRDLNGTPQRPIKIFGPSGLSRAVFLGSNANNTVSIRESSYIEIYNLELNGLGLAGDGVNADGNGQWAHHITIENFLIHGYDKDQSVVAISTNGCVTWGWVIRGNVILNAGTGMYLGNSDGNHQFINGLIEYNVITNTLGYNVEIKHQNARPVMFGLPIRSTKTIIRHNVFSKINYSATGENSRPNLLVGHWPLTGYGTHDLYEIYGNFFYQNISDEALFQGEGNIALYNNIFINDVGDAINIQPHNDVPRKIRVFNNTIVANGTGIHITGVPSSFRPVVENNAVFSMRNDGFRDNQANVLVPYSKEIKYLKNPRGSLGILDLFPKTGMLRRNVHKNLSVSMFADWDRDFNGNVRDKTYFGAYAGEGDNPGWLPNLNKKPTVNVR